MNKSKRFKPIVNLARDMEREAARALGSALQQLNEQTQRLDQLIAYQNEYSRQLNTSGSHGMKGHQLNEYVGFIAKISAAIASQKKQVVEAEKQLQEKKHFWFAKRGKSRALDAVLDKYIQDERKQLEKKEQRELDDLHNRTTSS